MQKKPLLPLFPFLLLGVSGSVPSCVPESSALPVCDPGQAIGFDDSGQAVCQGLGAPRDGVPMPVCTADEALTVEPRAVRCVPRTDAPSLLALEQQVADIRGKLTRASSLLAEQPRGTFVGLTSQTTPGQLNLLYSEISGLVAATQLCRSNFGASSSVCTPYDLHQSASRGELRSAMQVPASWIYFPAWNENPLLASRNPSEASTGTGDTCGGFLYSTMSEGYRGTSMEWTTLPTGAPGFLFHTLTTCALFLPIACCR